MGHEEVSEYEKRRLTRIAENKARLETLGLPHLAFSLIASSSKQQAKERNLKKCKDKRSVGARDEEDAEYRPSDEDEGAEEDGEEQNSMDSEKEEEDARVSSSSRRKAIGPQVIILSEGNFQAKPAIIPTSNSIYLQGKNNSSLISAKVKRISNARDGLNESDFIDDEAALAQAISLSLGATEGDSFGKSLGNSATNIAGEDFQGKKYKEKTKEPIGRKNARKLNKARVQLTEDEVFAYFLSFDETGKGYITPRDVKRMVAAHDFSWTDMEIAHMINSFNNDGDGKLSLEDFRSIVSRCKMLQATEEN